MEGKPRGVMWDPEATCTHGTLLFVNVALGQLKDYKEANRGAKENWSHDPVILGTWGPL